MSWCEDYIDPFPRTCDHGVPDGINCGDCADEADEPDDEFTQGAGRLCVKCGTREAIVNRVCGMCSELHPYMV